MERKDAPNKRDWLSEFMALRGAGACVCEGQAIEAACVEIERLREVLHRIAEHHENQRDAWGSEEGDVDQARYHEERRDFALFHVTPNDRVEGRDAALSRRVPSHDGLCHTGDK